MMHATEVIPQLYLKYPLEILSSTEKEAYRYLHEAPLKKKMQQGHAHDWHGFEESLRQSLFAVINTGIDNLYVSTQPTKPLFKVSFKQEAHEVQIVLENVPYNENAFIAKHLIKGIEGFVRAVIRDLMYSYLRRGDIKEPHFVKGFLKNTGILSSVISPLVVCWGGHSITEAEYRYTKRIGYALGLYGYHMCTGCGSGAMKGPIKGAIISHLKQRMDQRMYLGISETEILQAEPPNPVVTDLIVMPNVVKRIEAFMLLGDGIVIFPGGVGTMEEIMFLLSFLLYPQNKEVRFPVIFTGNKESEAYFKAIERFLESLFGRSIDKYYSVVIDNPKKVTDIMEARDDFLSGGEDILKRPSFEDKLSHRMGRWTFPKGIRQPFEESHENLNRLTLTRQQPSYALAADLMKVFGCLVAAHCKNKTMQHIERKGPLPIRGEGTVIAAIRDLITQFFNEKRILSKDGLKRYEFIETKSPSLP